MSRTLIGAGGWAYFSVPGRDRLREYSRLFDFVEVDSTFYELPSRETVLSWRRRVPPDFEFAVKANRRLTHDLSLEPSPEAVALFREHEILCSDLKAEILVLQTPPTLKLTSSRIEDIENFFQQISPSKVRVAWEIRSSGGRPTPGVKRMMRDYGILPVTDLSKSVSDNVNDLLYSRLFGPGTHNIHQFSDSELEAIGRRIEDQNPEKTYLAFHSIKMYKDAARMKVYIETGSFPMATGGLGEESLREVLSEDTRFPISKEGLLRNQGWKLIDISEKRRVRAAVILERLPSRRFRNIRDLLNALPSEWDHTPD